MAVKKFSEIRHKDDELFEGEKRVIFTGSDILIEKCREYESEMPFTVQITKIGRYYTFKEES